MLNREIANEEVINFIVEIVEGYFFMIGLMMENSPVIQDPQDKDLMENQMIFSNDHGNVYYWRKDIFQIAEIEGRLRPKAGLRMRIDRKKNQV
jgi:hypothetical protein